MSQEDESIIYNTQDEKIFLGGAGIVAAHMSSLKSKVYLISVVGNDQNYKYVKKISEYKILNMIIKENSKKNKHKRKI